MHSHGEIKRETGRQKVGQGVTQLTVRYIFDLVRDLMLRMCGRVPVIVEKTQGVLAFRDPSLFEFPAFTLGRQNNLYGEI